MAWVAQDRVPARRCDEIRWSDWRSSIWISAARAPDGRTSGETTKTLDGDAAVLAVRCRRKDLPPCTCPTLDVSPGEGYRWLECHEIVTPTDEVFRPDQSWVKPLTRAGNRVDHFDEDDYPVRRSIAGAVPALAKTTIPLRAWVSTDLVESRSGYALWISKHDMPAERMTEVHGLQIYIENPLASGSGDAANEAHA